MFILFLIYILILIFFKFWILVYLKIVSWLSPVKRERVKKYRNFFFLSFYVIYSFFAYIVCCKRREISHGVKRIERVFGLYRPGNSIACEDRVLSLSRSLSHSLFVHQWEPLEMQRGYNTKLPSQALDKPLSFAYQLCQKCTAQTAV